VTRYPRSGKGRKWTVVELKAVGPNWKGDVVSDGDGLVGEVRVAGDDAISVNFRYGFRWKGKRAWHYCGTWPASSLEAIREARDRARGSLKAGVNPNDQRVATRIEEQRRVEETIQAEAQRKINDSTVQQLFDVWIADGVARKDGNAEIRRSFEKDVLPHVGKKTVREVTEHDLRALLRSMVARGVNRMAVNVSRDLKQMFMWAEKRQPWRKLLQEGNPAALVEIDKIVSPEYDLANTRSRKLGPAEIRELHDIFVRTKGSYEAAADKRVAVRPLQKESQIALWLCLSTCCRIGELLMTEWKHVDLQQATWFIPKENVKGSRGKKQDHLVYLSPFALRQFKALHKLTKHTARCFPARDGKSHVDLKSVSKQVGDRQRRFKQRKALRDRRNDDSLVLDGGKSGEWTPHDLRRTGATMMQALGVSPDVIDRCQNHVLAGSRVRRHYLTHEYAAEKKDAWHRLGATLDEILGAAIDTSMQCDGVAVRSKAGRRIPDSVNPASQPRTSRLTALRAVEGLKAVP
jgi:integrase